jgi:hypothetical protein
VLADARFSSLRKCFHSIESTNWLTPHSTAGMLLFLICATITGQQYAAKNVIGIGYANIVFVWLHGVAYSLAWSGLLVAYTVEILPYKLRAKGVFIMNLCVQVALTINNYVNPIPISEGGGWYNQNWKLFACYAGWVLLELIWIYYFYVETRYVALYPREFELKLTSSSVAPLSKRLRASLTAMRQRSRMCTSMRRAWTTMLEVTRRLMCKLRRRR